MYYKRYKYLWVWLCLEILVCFFFKAEGSYSPLINKMALMLNLQKSNSFYTTNIFPWLTWKAYLVAGRIQILLGYLQYTS